MPSSFNKAGVLTRVPHLRRWSDCSSDRGATGYHQATHKLPTRSVAGKVSGPVVRYKVKGSNGECSVWMPTHDLRHQESEIISKNVAIFCAQRRIACHPSNSQQLHAQPTELDRKGFQDQLCRLVRPVKVRSNIATSMSPCRFTVDLSDLNWCMLSSQSNDNVAVKVVVAKCPALSEYLRYHVLGFSTRTRCLGASETAHCSTGLARLSFCPAFKMASNLIFLSTLALNLIW